MKVNGVWGVGKAFTSHLSLFLTGGRLLGRLGFALTKRTEILPIGAARFILVVGAMKLVSRIGRFLSNLG